MKKFLLFLSLSLSLNSCQGMRTAFTKGMKFTNYALAGTVGAAGTLLNFCRTQSQTPDSNFIEKSDFNFAKAYPKTHKLVTQEFKITGLDQCYMFPGRDARFMYEFSAGIAHQKNFLILSGVKNCKLFEEILSKPESSRSLPEKEILIQFKGALDHEIGHILNNDFINRIFINHWITPISTAAWLGCLCLPTAFKIPGVLATAYIIPRTINWFVAYNQEKQADEHVRNDPDTLRLLATQYRLLENDIHEKKPLSMVSLLEKIANPVDTHPSNIARAQRFEERLKNLDQ